MISIADKAVVLAIFCCLGSGMTVQGQEAADKSKQEVTRKSTAPFKWNNPLSRKELERVPHIQHAAFESRSLGQDVGYCIYLPPQYSDPTWRTRNFPVVYYLHGGRPGNENKSIRLSELIHQQIHSGAIPPMIYVFVNGGPVSHYNMPNDPKAQGADVFIKELIPFIDRTYRTIANRGGRAIEGFSQGGRGTARLMFRYPDLFCSASPGGGGYATEKKISENAGAESEKLIFAEGDNAWDLAKAYAARIKNDPNADRIRILVHVGDKGFNYSNNLEWMRHLKELGIEHESVIVPNAEHSAWQIYQKSAARIMNFHANNFAVQNVAQ